MNLSHARLHVAQDFILARTRKTQTLCNTYPELMEYVSPRIKNHWKCFKWLEQVLIYVGSGFDLGISKLRVQILRPKPSPCQERASSLPANVSEGEANQEEESTEIEGTSCNEGLAAKDMEEGNQVIHRRRRILNQTDPEVQVQPKDATFQFVL
jgi:hypothetical protein